MDTFFYLLVYALNRGGGKKSAKTVYLYQENPTVAGILSEHYASVRVIGSLEAVPWGDLALRRVRFWGRPGKAAGAGMKRALARILFLDIMPLARLSGLFDAMLGKGGDKTIFVDGAHVIQILRLYFPCFRVRHGFPVPGRLATCLFRLLFKKQASRAKGVTVFIGIDVTKKHFFKAYRFFKPNHRVVVRFHDKIEERRHEKYKEAIQALLAEKLVNHAESYCRKDAAALGIAYRPNGVNPQALSAYKKEGSRQWLCSIVGAMTESRKQTLEAIKESLAALCPSGRGRMKTLMPEYINAQKQFQGGIPYREYLRITADSEIQIDLVRKNQDEGYSYRVPEALFLGQKIISNRVSLAQEDFYDPSRVFIWGVDPPGRLKAFLESETKPLPEKTLAQFDTRAWYGDGDALVASH